MFEPFPALLAFTPLILYLFALAILRIGGFVWVTTGVRDFTLVLAAISGMIVIGPMELFFPNATASLLGVWVWIPLLSLYLLFACLLLLGTSKKLVVYGRTAEQVYPALVQAASKLDSGAIENREQLQVHLPSLQAHFRLEVAPGYDCLSVLSFEAMLPPSVWKALQRELRLQLRNTPPPRPRRGWVMFAIASMMTFYLVRYVSSNPALLVEGFREWVIR